MSCGGSSRTPCQALCRFNVKLKFATAAAEGAQRSGERPAGLPQALIETMRSIGMRAFSATAAGTFTS
jgi:hypothetical protein